MSGVAPLVRLAVRALLALSGVAQRPMERPIFVLAGHRGLKFGKFAAAEAAGDQQFLNQLLF